MPLVRISHRVGLPAPVVKALSPAVHDALVAQFDVPPDDLFQILTEHEPNTGLIVSKAYLGIEHSDEVVFVQLTVSAGRSLEKKKALFRAIADNMARAGIRREDVIVNLVETARENWSFGNGEAQYA